MYSLLDRRGASFNHDFSAPLNSAQQSMDRALENFASGAANPYAIAGMTAGAFAYRFVRAGAFSALAKLLGNPESFWAASAVKGLSTSFAFASEVLAFEGTQRGLQVKWGGAEASLLDWSGENGLGHGLAHAGLSLGALKFTGAWMAGQNGLLQHAVSDSAVVLSRRWGAHLGILDAPSGSLAEQYAMAEASLLQMQLGLQFSQGLLPGLQSMGKGADLEFSAQQAGRRALPSASRPYLANMANAAPKPEEPAPITIKPGDLIGKYKVEALIGRGAMGLVYRVRHTLIDKLAAIKVLNPELMANEQVLERFRREAMAATRIGNPHIIDISDFGVHNGSSYYVMEYLEGRTLDSLLEKGQPVPLPRILHIAKQLADGLAAAHRAGIVHRDLKPENTILVSRGSDRDFVKILDFGIAKDNKTSARLTIHGQVFGTPQYMSPEQSMGEAVDARTDIYAFGMMLYELATGKLPFDSQDPGAILQRQVMEMPPPFSKIAPGHSIPPEFEAIVFKCLAKVAGDRYQSMEEVIEVLDRYHPTINPVATPISNPFPTVPAPGSRRMPALYVAGGIGLGGAALAGAFLAMRPDPTKLPVVIPISNDRPPAPPLPRVEPSADAGIEFERVVQITVEPKDAHVFHEGKDLGSGSVKLEFPEGGALTIEVRRAGYVSQKLEVDASQSELAVKLEPLAPAKKAPAKGGNRPAVKKGSPDGFVDPWKKLR